jgi:photosystem II stability/assembly factor-like uncharacterized protein
MRLFRVLRFVSGLCFVFAGSVFAARYTAMTTDGLNGEELFCFAASPTAELVFVGTSRSVYLRAENDRIWRPFCGATKETGRVSQIYFTQEGRVYIATEKGLFITGEDVSTCENVFNRSDQAENFCLSVAVLSNETVFLGTEGGLFFKSGKNDWAKVVGPFDKQEIVSLYGFKDVIYAATSSSIYKSDDLGKTWLKVFNIYSYDHENEAEQKVSEEVEERNLPAIRQITGDHQVPSILYAVTKEGVFWTLDGGKSWKSLGSAGLDTSELRHLFLDPKGNKKIAVTKRGFYIFENGGWELLVAAYDAKTAIVHNKGYLFLTGRDIFDNLTSLKTGSFLSQSRVGSSDPLGGEPTIQEVHKMTIEYCDVTNEKIKKWRQQASKKAIMPEVSVDFDRTITTALGATYNRIQRGPLDWGVSVRWDLGDLVYSSDQTSIDSRAKLMVELRNDVLSEVTRLYFERRKLQIELMSDKNDIGKKVTDKELRLAELTALIDRLTGGQYSKLLKSPH